ncbi:hypothetical protein [Streptomyces sp. NPDC057682]|uniref:hypothetical protein n=1 Tax=unclassified Streptomyces TaxID=2593676 RepID=UPI0036634AD0
MTPRTDDRPTALVTGTGIGRTFAQHLAAGGYAPPAVVRDPGRLQALTAQLGSVLPGHRRRRRAASAVR